MSTILVTGGAGYIGSHMCVELLQSGHEVVVLDNLSNSSARSLEAVERITQRSLSFHQVDLRDLDALRAIFATYELESVLHFAGLKAVGESVAKPATYYDNNVVGSLRLVEAMEEAGVRNLVFSSSATVYGMPEQMPITESFQTGPINPTARPSCTWKTCSRISQHRIRTGAYHCCATSTPSGHTPAAKLARIPMVRQTISSPSSVRSP